MIEDCVTSSEDVGYVIREMISELNVGPRLLPSRRTCRGRTKPVNGRDFSVMRRSPWRTERISIKRIHEGSPRGTPTLAAL